jgi:hypothetical protein
MLVTILPDWDAYNCEIAEEREVHVAEVQAPTMSRAGAKRFERFGTQH